ncbi:aminopeptidase Q [Sceloporus undulatus]|uniref:aminopeptidase Q n=1 Tax=Sceloporus undulatus TaxID=8520 RepID=UPI001C4B9971|nr:aminopeptidase Q [Sceloporus undulatus]
MRGPWEGNATPPGPPPRPPGPWDLPRLPPHLEPLHYSLLLWPPLGPGLPPPRAHAGTLALTLRCRRPTDTLLLHGHGLSLRRPSLWGPLREGEAGEEEEPQPPPLVPLEELWQAPRHQYWVLQLRRNLSAGALYRLRLAFQGQLQSQPHFHGLFLNAYKDQGRDRLLIASQLQPLDARKVYPCFDEPAMKATFNISIVHHPNYTALSNMPAIDVSEYKDVNESTLSALVNETTPVNWTVTTFGTTPKMSTYLTAFVVCEFGYVTTTERGNEIRIWAKKDAIQKGFAEYALNITGPIFSFMEDLFNISYPLSKTDLIALPDMGAGAMEHWGLMTFQESSLLYQPQDRFIVKKTWISQIVSHEIGHQWFGNLVTMEWWNDLWLNEGFASYLEYLGAHYIDSTVSLDQIFSSSVLLPMLEWDSLIESQSLSDTREKRKADEIIHLFGTVTYKKGASIIRMLSSFLTETLFFKALHSYLNEFSFSNAIQDDLWNHIQKVIDGQNDIHLPARVKAIMDTWTCQVGFPVLTVNFSTGNISQEQFWSEKVKNNTNNTWIIPISWIRNGTVQPLVWLNERSKIFPEMKMSDSEYDWIILNVNMTGYYRINYDQMYWRRLAKVLENDPKVIPVVNRLQLMADAFKMSWSGYTEYDTPLYLTKYLEKEDDILVWNMALYNLDIFSWDLIRDDYELYPVLKKYFIPRILPIFHHYASLLRQDFNRTADHISKYNIEKILATACWFGHRDCLNLVSDIFNWRMNHPEHEAPVCLSRTICCYGVQQGSDKEWDFLRERQKQNDTEVDEEYEIYFALGCTREPWLLQRFLQSLLNESISEPYYLRNAIQNVAKNEVGHRIAWKFVTDNWAHLYARYEFRVLRDFMESVDTDVEVQMIQGFLNNTLGPEQRINATDIVLEAKSAIEKRKKSVIKMIKWLKKNIDN